MTGFIEIEVPRFIAERLQQPRSPFNIQTVFADIQWQPMENLIEQYGTRGLMERPGRDDLSELSCAVGLD